MRAHFDWQLLVKEQNICKLLSARRGSGGNTGTGIKLALRHAMKQSIKSRDGGKTRRIRSPLERLRLQDNFIDKMRLKQHKTC